ncbi:MAG: ArsR/SmtB family transcription factor [Gemmataceae bacterium]
MKSTSPTNGKPKHRPAKSQLTTTLGITEPALEDLADIFKLLADKSRLKILLALAQNGEMHVSALCEVLAQSQPAVSHHLMLLRRTGLVGFRRDGKHNFYHVESDRLRQLLDTCFPGATDGPRQIQFADLLLAFKVK